VGHPPHDQFSAWEIGFNFLLEILLHAVVLHRRQELPVGKVWDVFFFTADADEALHIIVPGSDVLIAYGPVYRDAVFEVGFEIEITPSIAVPSPQQGAPTQYVGPYPVVAR